MRLGRIGGRKASAARRLQSGEGLSAQQGPRKILQARPWVSLDRDLLLKRPHRNGQGGQFGFTIGANTQLCSLERFRYKNQ